MFTAGSPVLSTVAAFNLKQEQKKEIHCICSKPRKIFFVLSVHLLISAAMHHLFHYSMYCKATGAVYASWWRNDQDGITSVSKNSFKSYFLVK